MIESIIRSLVFLFDQIIYGFIPTLYNFIDLLARQTLFSEANIQIFANNIYAVLGIFMLFRLAFVLLGAIINPDKLTDKQKGASKMMARAIVALILIVAIPWAFSFAFKFQSIVLDKNLIAKIIIGNAGAENSSPGQKMGKIALSSFLSCNENASDCDASELETKGYAMAFPSKDSTTPTASFKYLADHLNDKVPSKIEGEGDIYKYNYSAGMSTLCGGFIMLMLIIFSFDIATRVVKLGFLQLMSPVAVIGYIEPDGGIFNRWFKMCVVTYINLFIRLLAITFVIYILSLLDNANVFKNAEGVALTGATLAFVKIFIIIGSLLFAKEAPNMLKTLFKLDEGSIGSLNPLKKISSIPVIGGAAAAGIGMGAGATMKGMAGASGALRGGLNSSMRKGSFWAGASKGASAAAKNVPLNGKFGKQAAGMFGSGRKAADAGATSAMGVDTKTGLGNWAKTGINDAVGQMEFQARSAAATAQEAAVIKTVNDNHGDESSLFKNESFKSTYRDFKGQKDNVKNAKAAFTSSNNTLAQKQSEYGAASINYQTHIMEAKAKQAEALSKFNQTSPTNLANYSAAQQEYLDTSNVVNSIETGFTTAKTEYTNAQTTVAGAERNIRQAESSLAVYQAKFDEQKKLSANSSDVAAYDTFKKLDDTKDQRINRP